MTAKLLSRITNAAEADVVGRALRFALPTGSWHIALAEIVGA
jgi:hypothetical protein